MALVNYKESSDGFKWGARASLYILTFIAVSLVLKFGKDLLLPITLAIFLFFISSPLQKCCSKVGLNRWLSAILSVVVFAGFVLLSVYYLSSPFYQVFKSSGENLKNLEEKVLIIKKPMEQFSNTQEQVEKMTEMSKKDAVEVTVKEESFGATVFKEARYFFLKLVSVVVLFFFFSLYGDTFFMRLGLIFPFPKTKEGHSPILNQVKKTTCTYFLTVTLINSALGLAIGACLYLLDFPDPFLWGLIAGILNFVPYFGCLLGTFLVFLISFSVFDHFWAITLPPLSYLLINSLEGQVLTPLVLGSALRLSPLAILLSLLYWGAIWGIAGLFLAVPILILIKIICDHSKNLESLAILLEA